MFMALYLNWLLRKLFVVAAVFKTDADYSLIKHKMYFTRFFFAWIISDMFFNGLLARVF